MDFEIEVTPDYLTYIPTEEEDDDFSNAVEILNNLQEMTERPEKRRRVEANRPLLTERQIVHRMYGCRHCKVKTPSVEDKTIHERIDEIFRKMKETVNN
jgi:hypothetical protein